jgi:resuscitation-promoting factor RpfA
MSSRNRAHSDGSRRIDDRLLRRSVVVGVIATSLVGFTAVSRAQAADEATWDRVAQCESGGNWSAETGNGYHGGLQFAPGTWRAHGGKGAAQHASKAEQIRVAEKVLRTQGPRAWPVCGRKAGLGRGTADPAPAERTRSSGSRRGAESASRARPAPEPREHVAAGRAPARPIGGADEVVVAPGDSLAGIAARNDLPNGWQDLYAKNNEIVGPDPDLIYPGQRLRLR